MGAVAYGDAQHGTKDPIGGGATTCLSTRAKPPPPGSRVVCSPATPVRHRKPRRKIRPDSPEG